MSETLEVGLGVPNWMQLEADGIIPENSGKYFASLTSTLDSTTLKQYLVGNPQVSIFFRMI
jgi:hypothetical protein